VSLSYNPKGVSPGKNDDEPAQIGIFFAILIILFYINIHYSVIVLRHP
jgi:hypothetical protein